MSSRPVMIESCFHIRVVVLLLLGLLSAGSGSAEAGTDATLSLQIDLSPLNAVAVQADGRLRSFGSHAATYMSFISGPRSIEGQSPGFTYLDLMFRPQRYHDRDVIFVKNEPLCLEIIDLLKSEGLDDERAERMKTSRLIAPVLLSGPAVQRLLSQRSMDLIRTAKFVDMVRSGLAVVQPELLQRVLRIVPLSGDRADGFWLNPSDLSRLVQGHGAVDSGDGFSSEIRESRVRLDRWWSELALAWQSGDADLANQRIAQIASILPTLSPRHYPDKQRLLLESWYFRNGSMTKVWLIYLLSVIPLLMAVIYKWPRIRTLGLTLFVIAFLCQTASVAIRWYVSGRWPNANMFEAVTTASWFGSVGALILEYLARRSALRNIFALGAAIVSMAALMAASLLPTYLDSSMKNKMPALNDVWLYIHTNVIIWSYAVIALAAVTALLYLAYRWINAWRTGQIPRLRLSLLPLALVVLNVTGWKVLMIVLVPERYSFAGQKEGLMWFGSLGVSAAFVLFEALEVRRRRRASRRVAVSDGHADHEQAAEGFPQRPRTDDRASAGGADMLIRARGSSFLLADAKPTAGQVFDAATMVCMEVAFIMLWTGLVMGAIWADHSWGRPWGWDPKEVFALNTFIIFLLLVHVRLKVRDKGLWTAVLAVVGFQVMMFNWIIVNFVIVGLHSYA